MNKKFGECVFVAKDKNTFLEYESIDDLLADWGEVGLKEMIGYFPKESNITYDEFKSINDECNWVVAYHEGEEGRTISYMKLKFFYSTLELKRKLDDIVKNAYRNENYVTLYKAKDLIYF